MKRVQLERALNDLLAVPAQNPIYRLAPKPHSPRATEVTDRAYLASQAVLKNRSVLIRAVRFALANGASD